MGNVPLSGLGFYMGGDEEIHSGNPQAGANYRTVKVSYSLPCGVHLLLSGKFPGRRVEVEMLGMLPGFSPGEIWASGASFPG